MVNKYEIVTAQGILDTYGETNITITKKILDILDISKRETSISQNIELPSTPFNNRFFKNIYNVNIDSLSFNPARSIPAIIKVGSNEVLKGNLQLLEIRRDNEEIIYEIAIAGELSNLYQAFGDFTLANLDMSEFNHYRNQENIVNSWDYKIYQNGSLVNVGEGGTGYVYGYHINGNNTGIYNQFFVQDATPWPYVKTVVDKMFQFTGYKYKSRFFESDYFKKLVLNYVGDRLQLSEAQVDYRTAVAGVNPATPLAEITQPTYDNVWQYNDNYIFPNSYYLGLPRETGTVDNTTGELTFRDDSGQFNGNQFTAANAGRYDITFNGVVVPKVSRDGGGHVQYNGGSAFEYRYQMFLFKANGTSTVLWESGTMNWSPDEDDHAENPYYYNDAIPTINMEVDNLFMEVGDRIAVRLGFRFPEGTDWQGNDNDYNVQMYFKDVRDGEFTFFRAKPSNSEDYGDTEIDMNQVLNASYKMTDFWNDLVNMFNLVVMDDPEEENTLVVEPSDDFFNSSQKVLNWDGDEENERKLDLDSPIKIKPISELDAKVYKFTYSEDDDFLNKEYTRETGRVYGDYEIEVVNDFSEKINTTKLSLSPTPVGSQWIDSRVAPLFVNYEDETITAKKPKQRMLFYGGRQEMYSGSVMWIRNYPGQPDNQSTPVTSYGYVGMWETPRNAVNSLEFGRPSKIYYDAFDTYPNQTLFEKFHRATLNNIIDINARLLECTVKLTPKDIATFDFRNIIYLLGAYWRVNTIVDYNPVSSDCLTKVILYKIIDLDVIDRYQVQIPTSNRTCPVDMISKKTKKGIITVSQSGLEVTQDCCNSLGGTYLGGVCYLNTIKPTTGNPVFPSINTGFGGPVRPVISGGLASVPVKAISGPIVLNKDNTTRGSVGIKTTGTGNYIAQGVTNSMVMGNNNAILSGVTNVFIADDNVSATGSSTVYTKNIQLSSGGTINGVPVESLSAATSGDFCATGVKTTTVSACTYDGIISFDYFGGEAVYASHPATLGGESYLLLRDEQAYLSSSDGSEFRLGNFGGGLNGIRLANFNNYIFIEDSTSTIDITSSNVEFNIEQIQLNNPMGWSGSPVSTLGIDANGYVVTGSTSSNDFCGIGIATDTISACTTNVNVIGSLTAIKNYTNQDEGNFISQGTIPSVILKSNSAGRLGIYTNYFANDSTSFLTSTGTVGLTGGTIRLHLDHTNGNFGIGQTSPSQKLDVNGTAKANSFLISNTPTLNNASTKVLARNTSTGVVEEFALSALTQSNNFCSSGITVSEISACTANNFNMYGTVTFSGEMFTTVPADGIWFNGRNNDDSNTAFGRESLTNASNTGTNNTAYGRRALFVNTSGARNTGLGWNALRTNTVGNDSTAVGSSALIVSTGSNNTGVGSTALGANTSATNNTALGVLSLANIVTTSNNTAVGMNAGRLIANGSVLSAATSSTFIGYNTSASANGLTNETVIGFNAVGSGSNTVTIGSTGNTATYLKGRTNLQTVTGTSVSNLGIDANGFIVTASTVTGVQKYTASVNLSSGNNTITHNLGTPYVTVQVWDASGALFNPNSVDTFNTNDLNINVLAGITGARVVIIG